MKGLLIENLFVMWQIDTSIRVTSILMMSVNLLLKLVSRVRRSNSSFPINWLLRDPVKSWQTVQRFKSFISRIRKLTIVSSLTASRSSSDRIKIRKTKCTTSAVSVITWRFFPLPVSTRSAMKLLVIRLLAWCVRIRIVILSFGRFHFTSQVGFVVSQFNKSCSRV